MKINVKKGDGIGLEKEIHRILKTQLSTQIEDEMNEIADLMMDAFNQYLVGNLPRLLSRKNSFKRIIP